MSVSVDRNAESNKARQEEARVAKLVAEEARKRDDEHQNRVDKQAKTEKKQEATLIARLLSNKGQDAKEEIVYNAFTESGKLSDSKKTKDKQFLENRLKTLFKDKGFGPDRATLSSEAAKRTEKKWVQKETRRQEAEGKVSVGVDGGEDGELLPKDPLLRERVGKQSDAQRLHPGRVREQAGVTDPRKALVQDYAAALSAYVASQDPGQKEILDQLKRQMRRQGITFRQIQHMETMVGQVVKQHFIYALKTDFIRFFFSKSEKREHQYLAEFDYNEKSRNLALFGSKGIVKGDLSRVMEGMGTTFRRDMEHFLYEEAGRRFVQVSLGQKSLEEYTEDLVKLQKIAVAAGVVIDEDELQAKVYRAIDEEGLEYFIPPNQNALNYREGDPRGKPQIEPKQYVNQEEALEDKLRNLYMMKALNPRWKGVVVHFKMLKLRNGLVKLGIYTEERDKELRQEGAFLAHMRLVDQLRDSYREQATLLKLSGTSYALVRKRRAFILKKLRDLGYTFKLATLDKIRDEANLAMYPVIRDEMHQLEIAMEVRKKTVHITRRYKMLEGIMSRLKKESRLPEFDTPHGRVPFVEHQVAEAA